MYVALPKTDLTSSTAEFVYITFYYLMKFSPAIFALFTAICAKIVDDIVLETELQQPYPDPITIFEGRQALTQTTLILYDKQYQNGVRFYNVTNAFTGEPIYKISNPTGIPSARNDRVLASLDEKPVARLVDNSDALAIRICYGNSSIACPAVAIKDPKLLRVGYLMEVFSPSTKSWIKIKVLEHFKRKQGADIYVQGERRRKDVLIGKIKRLRVVLEPFLVNRTRRRSRNLVVSIAPGIDVPLMILFAELWSRGR